MDGEEPQLDQPEQKELGNHDSNDITTPIIQSPPQQKPSPLPTTTTQKQLHIAPMLDVSNREFRHLFRILSKKCILWTEMVVDETIAHAPNLEFHLGYDAETQPLICQIGGNSPEYCGKATRVVQQEYGYKEVNLNIDCPSNRVSGKREFGAVLMKKIDTAVSVLRSMNHHKNASSISVKCRVGIDEHDDLDYLTAFLQRLRPYCKKFYLHARKCVLGGLTPAQNHIVPPLNYPRVYTICDMFPDCEFWLNGGIPGLKAAKLICYGSGGLSEDDEEKKKHEVPCSLCAASNGSCIAPPNITPVNLRGCMLGRAAMDNPSMFADVDRYFYGDDSNPCKNRREVLLKYAKYLERTYPRRCCDDDARITIRIPAPDVIMTHKSCEICTGDTNHNEWNTTSKIKPSLDAKISSRVIDRSLKPILGMFFGLSKSKTFRRRCDELSRDRKVRNCGPAFIVRKAMESIPDYILDQGFVKTELLTENDVAVHHGPRSDGHRCCSVVSGRGNRKRKSSKVVAEGAS